VWGGGGGGGGGGGEKRASVLCIGLMHESMKNGRVCHAHPLSDLVRITVHFKGSQNSS